MEPGDWQEFRTLWIIFLGSIYGAMAAVSVHDPVRAQVAVCLALAALFTLLVFAALHPINRGCPQPTWGQIFWD